MQNCEILRHFNACVSQEIATSLQKFFNDEKANSEKSVTSKDKECPFVKLDSQEAYRLKIYMYVFL